MTRHCVLLSLGLVLGVTAVLASPAGAQPIGTFRWQLQPYCNIVTLHVAAQGAIFTLDGFDDQCGAGQRASVTGTAFQNPDGSIGIGLNTVLAPGGAFVHVDARIGVASLNGPWRDSAGNSGTFVVTPGLGTSGPARPVSANGIALGSIGAAQLAPGVVGGGQINRNQVQARVSGTCPVGQYLRGIHSDGTVLCEPLPLSPVANTLRVVATMRVRDDGVILPNFNLEVDDAVAEVTAGRVPEDGSLTGIYRIRLNSNLTALETSLMATSNEAALLQCATEGVRPELNDWTVGCYQNDGTPAPSSFTIVLFARD